MMINSNMSYVYEVSTYVKINGGDAITVGRPLYRIASEEEIRYTTPDDYDGTVEDLERFVNRYSTVINGINAKYSVWYGEYQLLLKYNELEEPYKYRYSKITRVQVGVSYRKVDVTLADLITTFPVDQSLKYIKERLGKAVTL